MRHNINISNYESFALDYLEGNLRGEELNAFLAFLSIHPEIEAEMEGELPQLSNSEPSLFSSKISLFKNPIELPLEINSDNYIEFFIAFHENDLNEHQKQLVLNFLSQHPATSDDFELVRKSRLESSIRFEYEEKLDLEIDEEFQMSNYDKKLIGYFENDLTFEEQKSVLETIEKSSKSKSEFELYGKTKFIADTSIQFPNKSSLKQFQTGNLPWFGKMHRVANFAASIAAAVLVGFFNPDIVEIQTSGISQMQNQSNSTNTIVENNSIDPHQVATSVNNSRKAQVFNAKQNKIVVKKVQAKQLNNLPKSNTMIAYQLPNTNDYIAQKADLNLPTNQGTSTAQNNEEVLSSHPLYTFAAERVKSLFNRGDDESTLEINWKNAAKMSLNSLGRITESSILLSYAPNNFDQNEIFSLRKKD